MAQFALVDWGINEEHTCSLLRVIRCNQPACHVLLLMPPNRQALEAGLRQTVAGYLAAPLCPDEVVLCLDSIQAGNGYWNQALLTLLTGTLPTKRLNYPAGLTKRETEMWKHLANGLSNQQIEAFMFLGASRVKNMKNTLAQKLGLATAHQLTGYAVQWTENEQKNEE